MGHIAQIFDWWISLITKNPYHHDTYFHSVVWLIPSAIVLGLVFDPSVVVPFAVGYMTHPLLDGIGSPSPWLYPFSETFMGLGLWENYYWQTGSAWGDFKRYHTNPLTLTLEFLAVLLFISVWGFPRLSI